MALSPQDQFKQFTEDGLMPTQTVKIYKSFNADLNTIMDHVEGLSTRLEQVEHEVDKISEQVRQLQTIAEKLHTQLKQIDEPIREIQATLKALGSRL